MSLPRPVDAAGAGLRAMWPRAPRMARWATAALLFAALSSASVASAGGRARYGGTLKVGVLDALAEGDPALLTTPMEATLLGLVTQPLCALNRSGPVATLAAELTLTPQALRVALRGPLLRADGSLLTAAEVLEGLERVLQAPSPYRALLAPFRRSAGRLEATLEGNVLTLGLAVPWADAVAALCHPALAPATPAWGRGLGPFRGAGTALGRYLQHPSFPSGRPFVDTLEVSRGDARALSRGLQTRKLHLALGVGPELGPALAATYVVVHPTRAGAAVKAALEASIADIAVFARQPAAPLTQLLGPAQGLEPQPRLAPLAPPAANAKVTLLFDDAVPEHRLLASRLQFKLHALGVSLAVEAQPRRALWSRWAAQDYELVLMTALLPPQPAPALAVLAELAHAPKALARVLALGALPDGAREKAARELSLALGPELSLVPLFAQGLPLQAAPSVQGLERDAWGVPLLEGAWLSGEP